MWEPVDDSLGQVASGEDNDLPDVLLPWGRSVTTPNEKMIWGRFTSAPDQPAAKVFIKNTFLEINWKELVAPHRPSSTPPALFHVSEQETSGEKRTPVASPWGVLR